MYKRIALAAVLIATLGLAGTASAAPTASNEGAGVLAANDTFRAWDAVSYEGTPVGGLRGTGVVVQDLGVSRFSAALIDRTVQVELFSGAKDPATNTCTGTPVATLNAANMADSGWVARSTAGSPRTPLGDPALGARCAIITPI